LDVVLGGHRGASLDPAAHYLQPGSEFGQVLAAAFDRGMSPADWRMVDNPVADPVLVAELRTVLAAFADRFGFVVA
jgi:hypothetical protein